MCTLFMKLSDSCLIKSVLITFDDTIHYCFGKKALERDSRRLLCGAGEENALANAGQIFLNHAIILA